MFNRVYALYFEREINHVLAEQDAFSVGPGIGSSARYIRGLPWLHKLCLHSQQEIAIDGQRVRDRSDQERLNVSQVGHPLFRRRAIQRNGLAQSKACRSERLLSVGSEVRPADFFIVSTVRVTLHHVSSLNGVLPAVVITCH